MTDTPSTTELPKTFDPAAVEHDHYARWENAGAFTAHPESNAAPFTIMIPPPNVTGSLHMGHALTNTLQDILIRVNRMKGRDALWLPGTDHAGIATQMVVERQLEAGGESRQKMGREAFLKRVWEWKATSGGRITHQLRKLGASLDWSRERFTMDDGLSTAVIKVFVDLYKQGLIYKDKRLVNWDPKLLTAVSDLEVEQKETKTHLWHIAYAVEGDREHTITVATTRPETLLGDTAIAVNPNDERYKDMIGKFAIVPIVGRLIPIVADDYADPEAGSGAVKITPAHDFNDFEVGRRHGLQMIPVLDIHARINENGPEEYQGLDRYDARKKILKELEETEALVRVEDYTTMLPYSQRSGVVIEPFLSDQWYVDAQTLAKPAIEAVRTGKTKFVPQQWENTYFQWMENIQPWCVSRQLWWGHQIPAWYGPDNTVFVESSEADAQKAARAHYGTDVKLTRDPDVLDTWFSSALWPFSTLGWPEKTADVAKYYPGDVLITGFDIIFFWVARMMMMGIHFMGEVPFKTVYIHGLVRDAKGQKMSKTKGNVIDPLDLSEKYGADALRMTLAALATQGRDVKFGDKVVEGYRNFATKLWNASRYAQMQGCTFGGAFDPATLTHGLNKWIVAETKACEQALSANIADYRYDLAAKTLYDFVWGTVCDWYLEAAKVADSAETKATTAWVLDQILLLLNPFMPFITQELFDKLHGRSDVFLMSAAWPTYDFAPDIAARDDLRAIQDIVTEIRSVRAAMNVPAGAQVPLIVLESDATRTKAIKEFGPILEKLARLSSVTFDTNAPKGSVRSVAAGVNFALPVADLIDLAKEKTRLQKEVGKLESDLQKLTEKLANDDFVSKAPEEILEEQRRRAADTKVALTRLSAALQALAA